MESLKIWFKTNKQRATKSLNKEEGHLTALNIKTLQPRKRNLWYDLVWYTLNLLLSNPQAHNFINTIHGKRCIWKKWKSSLIFALQTHLEEKGNEKGNQDYEDKVLCLEGFSTILLSKVWFAIFKAFRLRGEKESKLSEISP